MSSQTEGFICERLFEEHPRLKTLIELWSTVFDERDTRQLSPLDEDYEDKLTMQSLGLAAAQLLMEHYPDIDPFARAGDSLSMDNADLWSMRAMLAASEIRDAFNAVEPSMLYE